MNKNQTRLMQVAKKAGNNKLAVQIALQASIEGGNQVYLPNAYDLVSDVMTNAQFAGYLSALAADGVYQSQADGFFGSLI